MHTSIANTTGHTCVNIPRQCCALWEAPAGAGGMLRTTYLDTPEALKCGHPSADDLLLKNCRQQRCSDCLFRICWHGRQQCGHIDGVRHATILAHRWKRHLQRKQHPESCVRVPVPHHEEGPLGMGVPLTSRCLACCVTTRHSMLASHCGSNTTSCDKSGCDGRHHHALEMAQGQLHTPHIPCDATAAVVDGYRRYMTSHNVPPPCLRRACSQAACHHVQARTQSVLCAHHDNRTSKASVPQVYSTHSADRTSTRT